MYVCMSDTLQMTTAFLVLALLTLLAFDLSLEYVVVILYGGGLGPADLGKVLDGLEVFAFVDPDTNSISEGALGCVACDTCHCFTSSYLATFLYVLTSTNWWI